MIFSCSHLISYVSQFIKLEPGDVISTGTPEGVIMGFPENKRKWLSDIFKDEDISWHDLPSMNLLMDISGMTSFA